MHKKGVMMAGKGCAEADQTRWRTVMKYVWFDGIDGRAVAVNPANVLWVRDAHSTPGKTYISFGKDVGLTVNESPKDVTKSLEAAFSPAV
jgi:hypothetical protein